MEEKTCLAEQPPVMTIGQVDPDEAVYSAIATKLGEAFWKLRREAEGSDDPDKIENIIDTFKQIAEILLEYKGQLAARVAELEAELAGLEEPQ